MLKQIKSRLRKLNLGYWPLCLNLTSVQQEKREICFALLDEKLALVRTQNQEKKFSKVLLSYIDSFFYF